MNGSSLTSTQTVLAAAAVPDEGAARRAAAGFRREFDELFDAHFARVHRVLQRWTGDPELADDLAQDTFVKLFERGARPERPEAWLITIALNLLRNAKSKRARRRRLLTVSRAANVHADPPPSASQSILADETRARVRRAVDRLPERERGLLLLRAEGYSYRELAEALGLHEASIGTLLARAKRAFRERYEEGSNAS